MQRCQWFMVWMNLLKKRKPYVNQARNTDYFGIWHNLFEVLALGYANIYSSMCRFSFYSADRQVYMYIMFLFR